MTVSVARGTARRTVRVAVALVAGQAALCAVIGYVTLGGPFLHKSTAAQSSDPLAAGPIEFPPAQVMPVPTSVAPAPPPVPASSSKAPKSTGVSKNGTPAEAHNEAPPSLVSAPLDPSVPVVPPRAPTKAPSPSTGNQLVTPSATATDIQHNVNVGDTCSPLGADGQTSDGKAVTCIRDVDGTLRWVLA